MVSKIVDLLTALQNLKIDWWTEFVMAIIAATVLILAYFEVLWFSDIPSLYLVGLFIVFMFCVLHQLVGDPLKHCLESRRRNIQCSYNKLSPRQKELLTCIFKNNSRQFRFETEKDRIIDSSEYVHKIALQILDNPVEIPQIPRLLEPHDREFEMLENYNYIESEGKFKEPKSFSVTENGWLELEKNLK